MLVSRTARTAFAVGLCLVALPIMGASSPKQQASREKSATNNHVQAATAGKRSQNSVPTSSGSPESSPKPNFYVTDVRKNSSVSQKPRAKKVASTRGQTSRSKSASTVAGPNSVRRLVPLEESSLATNVPPTVQLSSKGRHNSSSQKIDYSVREITDLSPTQVTAAGARQSALARLNPINLFNRRQEEKLVPTGYVQTGIASWYGKGFHGGPTASGERYDMNTLTAAHPTLPFGTLVRVTNLQNGRDVVVRVNNRGPFRKNRIIDLSKEAARQLGMVGSGLAKVRVEVVTASESIGRWGQATLRKLSHK